MTELPNPVVMRLDQDRHTCFICRKHAGEVTLPPGGYLYEDDHWQVCHAPVSYSAPGTLILEARRHVLDFADMNAEEASGYGPLLCRLYAALRQVTGAERIYCLVTLEGEPHFHAWLVPRPPKAPERGLAFLGADHSCSEGEALRIVTALRQALSVGAT